MRRETLAAIRDRIEGLATAGGDYYVVCARTGRRPVPIDGLSFPDREAATGAARAAATYRSVLREYDPQAPVYDFVACQRAPPEETPARARVASSARRETDV